MQERINYMQVSPDTFKAIWALEEFISQKAGIEPSLLHLIKIRASQINGCAFCVDMHVKEARKDGHGEQWTHLISAWHESPVYTARERAVLTWTESLTKVAHTGAPDDAFEELRAHFSDEEITNLTAAVGMINLWNRLAVGFRSQHPIDLNE